MIDFVDTSEQSPRLENKFVIKDFFNLTPDEAEKLQNEVSNSHGTVQLWVHTHFLDDHHSGSAIHESQDGLEYMDTRKKVIEKASTGKLPVIALLEGDEEDIDRYQEYYSFLNPNLHLYFIRTDEDNPTPVTGENITQQTRWNVFSETLKKYGITKAILLGRELYHTTPFKPDIISSMNENKDEVKKFIENNPEFIQENGEVVLPLGCVGTTAMQLSIRGIKIKISKVTYPEKA
ncbi:MAG TPA: hypothetical protein VK338_03845 [Candidatus Nitrosocosmicus sp.]|nr:hypothetical protein [Candidatus Nitrosocosmicus sp.]